MTSRVSQVAYVQDYIPGQQSRLYELNLDTGRTTLVGEIGTEIYDIASVGSELYGLDKKDFGFRKTMKLIRIDRQTGKTETVGDIGFDVVGLAYNPKRERLYATAHKQHQLIEIDHKTGKGKSVVTLSDRTRAIGELAFDPGGTAYITLTGADLKKYLATCNLDTGAVNLIGDTYFPGLASMKFIGDTLYGVGGYYEGLGGANGQLIRIDTDTGAGSLLKTTDPALRWAGISVLERGLEAIPVKDVRGDVRGDVKVAGAQASTSREADVRRETKVFDDRRSTSEEFAFAFRLDETQLEEMWKKVAAKVETAVTVTDEQDVNVEARYWDQLEKQILKGYQTQAKGLAMQVARLELRLNALTQQIEGSLNQAFRGWSAQFDNRLESLTGDRNVKMVEGVVNVAIEQKKLEIVNQVIQQMRAEISKSIETKIGSVHTEIDRSLETRVGNLHTEIDRSLETRVGNLHTEIDRSLETRVGNLHTEINKGVETKIGNLHTEIDRSLETRVGNLHTEIDRSLETRVGNLHTEIDRSLETRVGNLHTEINKGVETRIGNVRTEIDKSIETKVSEVKVERITEVPENVTNEVTQNITNNLRKDIDVKIEDVQKNFDVKVLNVQKNFDVKINDSIENFRSDFRSEVVSTVIKQLNQLIEEKIKLEVTKVNFDQYTTEIDARINKNLQRLNQLEANLTLRINQGDTSLYNWVLEQLMILKGCLTDRQVLVDQFVSFTTELRVKLDNVHCVNPSELKPWNSLPAEQAKGLPSGV